MNKKILIAVMLMLVALFFAFDLQQWLSLTQLKQSQAQLSLWQQQSPVLLTLTFFAVYILVAALSLPGAAILTLAAGAIFGLALVRNIIQFSHTNSLLAATPLI